MQTLISFPASTACCNSSDLENQSLMCWGFQPSMYFIRDGSHPCIGELLRIKAANGVKVRILGWEMPFNCNRAMNPTFKAIS